MSEAIASLQEKGRAGCLRDDARRGVVALLQGFNAFTGRPQLGHDFIQLIGIYGWLQRTANERRYTLEPLDLVEKLSLDSRAATGGHRRRRRHDHDRCGRENPETPGRVERVANSRGTTVASVFAF